MSRIAGKFAELKTANRSALVTFITAGDPTVGATVPLMRALVAAGADILELGVPFSDPMADGPVIQRASERALAHGMTLRKTLAVVDEFRGFDATTPVVLMGYMNPFESLGYETFARRAAAVGVDGAITVDLPPEEAEDFVPSLRAAGLDPIFLLAPNSNPQRIRNVCRRASGFVYYVSLKGVTGAATLDTRSVAKKVAEIKSLGEIPVGVGFGIRDAQSAGDIAAFSDAVVVGSALVEMCENGGGLDDIAANMSALVLEMRSAMDSSRP